MKNFITISMLIFPLFADVDYEKTKLDPQSVMKMPHVSRIIQTGGVKTATTFDKLYSDINDYLDDPSLDSKGRTIIEKNFVGDFMGRGSEATAEYIHSLLDNSRKGKKLT